MCCSSDQGTADCFSAYFLSSYAFLTADTSKSMWMNLPIAVFLVSGLRILFNEVDFHWKVRKVSQVTYLSHLEKKQLSVNDSRLSTVPLPPKWKRKIDSPVVEAAVEDFVNKLLQDFVVDLWYSAITSDLEAPKLIHDMFMDALGEVSGRVKEINLVDLLTRFLLSITSLFITEPLLHLPIHFILSIMKSYDAIVGFQGCSRPCR